MNSAEPSPAAKPASPAPAENLLESKPAPMAPASAVPVSEAKQAPAPTAVPKPAAPAKAPEPEAHAKTPGAPPEAKVAKARMDLRNKVIFGLSILGVLAALVAAYLFGIARKAQPPVFAPVSSPYESAIYANGIVESDQSSGSNINIYPEVSGPITRIFVHEGQVVSAGMPLLAMDDSVQKAQTEQLRLQAEAALALLNELKAEPRMEALAIAAAQVDLAEASLRVARDQYDKDRASYDLDPKSISKGVLDTADDTARQASAARRGNPGSFLRREKRSSCMAATSRPSTTRAAAASW